MQYNDFEFVDAYFLNNEKTIVEVVRKKDNEIYPENFDLDESHDLFKGLLKDGITLDWLYERTVNRNREIFEVFKSNTLTIAKEEGLIYEADLNPEFYSDIVKFIFENDETESSKEKLFLLKLKMFEDIEEIRKSKNVDLKSKLRKSKTAYEAVKAGIEIYEESKQQ